MKWKCGHFALEIGARTYVMGILNVTPDSFSGDGVLGDWAVENALKMVENGADLLDIGGESTRPGALPVSLDEELSRVIPVVEKLAARVEIPLSIDTTKSQVAKAAIDAGVSIVNDISGATFDPKMLETCAGLDCGVILMHLRGTPQKMRASENFGEQNDVISEILDFWRARLEAAKSVGIAQNRLCFDAGFGFGKSLDENLEIIRRGRELRDFGFPILSATSRKSTIGRVTGDLPSSERVFGTAATVALAIQSGADIVRVHDVAEMKQVAQMSDAIWRPRD